MAKVLIVEDNDMLNTAFSMVLSHNGHEVATAFNGQEGLEKALAFKPAVIVLDYLMPVMDGGEFINQFKPKSHPKTKIILLTNLDDQVKLQEALNQGVAKYALKSEMGPKELAALVAELAEG